ncbi:MAG: DUF362 domain-containing protein [Promethearchaeota archaeon]|nr:MAG: DUF362 domain-containing protein [Candidatus Lokiarchaeota archaeon]
MDDSDVIIAKGNNPTSAFLNGVDLIGGFKTIIATNDTVFIKFALDDIQGFPTHSNIEILNLIIKECKDAGARQIHVGITREIDLVINLGDVLESLGAHLSYLDDEEGYTKFTLEESKEIISIPELVLKCDKFIIFNQVNVHPLFQFSLALQNIFSFIKSESRNIMQQGEISEKKIQEDKYKKDLTRKILDVSTIRKPDLIINDIFYVLEGAGPNIYAESNLKTTNLMIFSSDLVTIDYSTLKILGIDPFTNDLIESTVKRKLTSMDLENLNFIGEPIEGSKFQIKPCEKNLELLNVYGTDIKTGVMCSGCFERAYHLLNFMNTMMTKDLKYVTKQSILIGHNPKTPENNKNIILFGDCAINSTKNYDFNTIKIKKEVIPLMELIKKRFKKENVKNRSIKRIEKKNKRILSLSGCPPDLQQVYEALRDFYTKKDTPNLHFYLESLKRMNKERERGS